MKKLAISLLFILTSLQAAVTDPELVMNQTYLKAFKHATINCEYRYWLNVEEVEVISQEFFPGSRAQAQFKIGENTLSLVAMAGDRRGIVDFRANGVRFETYLQSLDGIGIQLRNLNSQQQYVANKLNLENLTCSLEIGREDHHVIGEKDLHINMHPHPGYDLDGESIPGMVRELNDKNYDHLVLFDHGVRDLGRIRGANFNELIRENSSPVSIPGGFGAPSFEIPENAQTKVSQAGHNRYIMTEPEQNIFFTGGNHNFCILNNTRRLLHAFMENPERRSVKFNYITDAIVVQKGSWLRGAKIPRGVFRRTNLLKTVFENMSLEQRQKYVRSYFEYFKDSYLNEKKFYFKRAVIKTQGIAQAQYQEVVIGEGEGDIYIELNYL